MALLTDFKEIGKEHFLETASEIIDMINHSEDVKKLFWLDEWACVSSAK